MLIWLDKKALYLCTNVLTFCHYRDNINSANSNVETQVSLPEIKVDYLIGFAIVPINNRAQMRCVFQVFYTKSLPVWTMKYD